MIAGNTNGQAITLTEDSFYIKITEVSGSAHGWVRVERNTAHLWEETSDRVAATVDPAFEINGGTGTVGQVYKAWRHPGTGEVLFFLTGCQFPGDPGIPTSFYGITGTIEYLWMDELDAGGNWAVNAVAPNKWFLETIHKDRICFLTDLSGNYRQARGYAGFAFNAMTSTADNTILMPMENIFNASTRGTLPPAANSTIWPDITQHCLQVTPASTAIAPLVRPVGNLKLGLFSLGHLTRCVTDADEFSSCGNHPGSLCSSYSMHGPMKLGYLYGFAGDSTYRRLDHDMFFASQGGCKFSIEGPGGAAATMPVSNGFNLAGSQLPIGNEIKQSVPSESFIVLDGSRALRVRLTSWFAVISDVGYKNNFALLDTYINAACYEFTDNPYEYGGDPVAPDWQAGVQWYAIDGSGNIVFGNTIEHVGGHSYWVTKKWFKEQHPGLTFLNLHVLIKIYYALPPANATPEYLADPTPDPWAAEYFAGDYVVGGTAERGSRPPDEVIWMATHEVTTCHATGDPIFNVDPEYTTNQGYRFTTSQSVEKIAYIHFSYYHKGVLVGQKYQRNISPRTQYYPNEILANTKVGDGCGVDSSPYPSSANTNQYPFGALGQGTFKPIHATVYSRSSLAITFKAVYPSVFGNYTINFGDGSTPQTNTHDTNAAHTYAAAGIYEVTVSAGSFSSTTIVKVT